MNKRPPVAEKLLWDSKFFGFPMARINPVVLTPDQMKSALEFCLKNRIRCLFWRASSNDALCVELAEEHGFHLANFRMTYEFDFDLGHVFPQVREHEFKFRQARRSDLSELMAISKNLYLDSRYYYDRTFSRVACDRFYGEWIKKLVNSQKTGQQVYVLDHGKKIAAYIGYEVSDGTVRLVLVGVSHSYQGRGVGKILLGLFLKQMFKEGFTKFEVVTQGRNIASQRLYQSCGFKIAASHIDYHRWFEHI